MSVMSVVRVAFLLAFAGMTSQGCLKKTKTEQAVEDLQSTFDKGVKSFEADVMSAQRRRLQDATSLEKKVGHLADITKTSIDNVAKAINEDLKDARLPKLSQVFVSAAAFALKLRVDILHLKAKVIAWAFTVAKELINLLGDDVSRILRKLAADVVEGFSEFVDATVKNALEFNEQIKAALTDKKTEDI
eukprot:GEMP01064465.1.p2 GENE.GEMP01064465.1~~GEMP01064465.1.p2  ORF type:complete len:189 (-),score=37.50 GEMP01064465.1:333-899(-)